MVLIADAKRLCYSKHMPDYNRQYWEDMYEMPLAELPWEIKEAPAELREYIEANKIAGGEALDAGCGTGNFSVYLAQNGFAVTGVDYSEKAIAIAKERSEAADLPVNYLRADLTDMANVLRGKQFDLILDYKVAHHLPDEQLKTYVSGCISLLKLRGRILLICYSDKDKDAAGHHAATGKFGKEMFYRSANEIRKIYKNLREISYRHVMLGKRLTHAGYCFVFEKRS
jgi:2-polyprenyl-3-methyl-5-hydroxy-6-metoxy-1,4-benzoquinol methylase